MATHLRFETVDHTAILTFFDENERHPCTLDWDVLAQLEQTLLEIGSRVQEYRAVVVQSDSAKAFVVGANIAVLQTLNAENIMAWVRNGHRIFNMFQQLPLPVIAKVGGVALGGGLELAMACDFIIAGENARFGQPEASLGVMPGWGGSYRLAKLVGPNRAKQMFMTAAALSANQALQWGLVNEVVPSERLDERVEQIVAEISQNDAGVLAMTKEILNHEWQNGMAGNASDEAITSSIAMNSPTTQKRLADFFERRKK